MNQQEYSRQMEALFAEWKVRKTVRIGGQEVPRISFNEDGIVNPEGWERMPEDKRILFVLKETHDDRRSDWSLVEWLRADESKYKIWRRTAEWTKGLISTTADQQIQAYGSLDREETKALIQNIAILNLKKTPGGSFANWSEIEAYAREDIDLIEREIGIIDPAIVVFGGTFWHFQRAWNKSDFKMHPDLRYCYGILSGKERLLIDYWHPANFYPAITSYYGIVGIYQAALKEKAK